MNNLIRILASAAALACLTASPRLSAAEAADVMKKVDDVSRRAFTTAVVKTQLSTCRYAVKGGNIACKERPRVTLLEVAEKKVGVDNKDSRSIALVLQPISDKDVGLLTYEYFQTGRENDVLLYLPALAKVRRLVSGGDGNEDGGSFFGTEFFSDDVQLRKIDEYDFKYLREDTHDGRAVWVIESVPNAGRARKTAYGKSQLWVDKQRNIILREDIFSRAGKLYRQRLNREVTQVEGVWMSKLQTMNNLVTHRISAIQNVSVTYNKSVPDELLTERSLTDFTFRERSLSALRTYYN